MKTQINEELNLIKYLFDYKKGKVISEQKITLITEGTEGQKNAKACGWTLPFNPETGISVADVAGYEASGWECPRGSGKKPEKKEIPVVKTPEQIKADLAAAAKKCGWGDDVKGYEASDWKCDGKLNTKSVMSSTATNIQTKLLELGYQLGSTGVDGKGVDGKIGPTTMKAIWEVLKKVK